MFSRKRRKRKVEIFFFSLKRRLARLSIYSIFKVQGPFNEGGVRDWQNSRYWTERSTRIIRGLLCLESELKRIEAWIDRVIWSYSRSEWLDLRISCFSFFFFFFKRSKQLFKFLLCDLFTIIGCYSEYFFRMILKQNFLPS